MADLDGDGLEDLISGSYSPGTIYWFRCKEGRTFEDKQVLVEAKKDESGDSKLTASAVAAVDWDGDELVDLIVGNISGDVLFLKNEGTKKKPKFAKPVPLEAGGKPIRSPGGDAGPCVADADGDGVPDLLVGDGKGPVAFYRNAGTAKKPDLEKGQPLLLGGKNVPEGSIRSKVAVADWNGDGKADLLVGVYDTKDKKLRGGVYLCPGEGAAPEK